MTERRGDPGYSVTTQRLGDEGGGPRGRRRTLISVLIVIVAVSIVGISVVSERLAERPSLDLSFLPTPTPRPTPSATPAPTASPLPSDLPRITRGAEIRAGRVPYMTEGFHILDLATGDIVDGPPAAFGRDLVFDDPAGNGWLCICGQDQVGDSSDTSTVQLIRIEPNGSTWQVVDEGIDLPTPAADEQRSIDIDLASDRSRALLAVTIGFGMDRNVAVAPIDARAASIGALVELPEPPPPGPSPAPSGSPTPTESIDPGNVGFDGPHVRISPDGQTAAVWDTVQAQTSDGVVTTRTRAWRLDLEPDGSIAASAPWPSLDGLPQFCQSVAYLAPDRLIWICSIFPTNPAAEQPSTSIRILDGAGRTIVARDVPANAEGYPGEPLVDRANGEIYLWDKVGLLLTRLDLATLTPESIVYDAEADVSAGRVPHPLLPEPDWVAGSSALLLGAFRSITPSTDGARLFLLGQRQAATSESYGPESLGVFVVERSTLALVDRWAPAAAYYTMAGLPDGQSVAVGGVGGIDTNGRETSWSASLTIHDAADGRIIVRFGRLGESLPPMVIPR